MTPLFLRVVGLVVLAFVPAVFGDPPRKAGEPPEDRSLPAVDYVKLGVPAHDRLWSGRDMAAASEALAALAKKDPARLPRHGSKNSGAVLARLIDAENLGSYRNKSLPISNRLPDLLTYFDALNNVLKVYLPAFQRGAVADTELIDLMGAQFRGVVVLLELTDEFLPTIPKDDPNYERRMAGFEKMKSGLALMVTGGLQSVGETGAYRASERARLLNNLKETLPTIVPRLSVATQTEMLMRLEKMATEDSLKDLRPALVELRGAVKKSTQAKPPAEQPR